MPCPEYGDAAGFGYGGSIVTVAVLPVVIFGERAQGKILGFVLLTLGAGSACGTLLVGSIYDRTNSYRLPFLVLFVMAILSAVIMGQVQPRLILSGASDPTGRTIVRDTPREEVTIRR